MKRITLDVTETARYSQSFEVPDDFDERDMEAVHALWVEKGDFSEAEVADRDIDVLEVSAVGAES